MPSPNKFHWANRVSRRDIQRLYESDAQGMLDERLIPEILRLAPELTVKAETLS